VNDDIKNTITGGGDPAGSAGGVKGKAPAGTDRSGDPMAGLDDPVPRLPRGRGLKLSRIELIRVVGLAAVLVFLIVAQRPCANAVSTFVTGFDERGVGSAGARSTPGSGIPPAAGGSAAGAATGSAGSDLEHYEQLRPGMTDDEIKAAIERARIKSAGGSGTRPR